MLVFRNHFCLLLTTFLLSHVTLSCCHSDVNSGFDLAKTILHNLQSRSNSYLKRSSNRKVAINNVRIFDSCKLLEPTTVVIDGDKIGYDATDAEQLDGQGHVLLPGLIDSHCHPANISHLEDLSRYSVTTAFSMACPLPQLRASLRNHRGLSDVRQASSPAAAPGSRHGMLPEIQQADLLSNSSQAVSWVDRQIAQGADYIKLIAETPGLGQQTLVTLTQESHRKGKQAICHAADYYSVAQALFAGVNQVHHVLKK